MTKQCINCKYGRKKPTKDCACNNKVKSLDEVVVMKYTGAGFPYCDGFKPEFKGQCMSGQKVQTKRNERNKHKWEKQVGHALRLLNRAKFFKYKGRGE